MPAGNKPDNRFRCEAAKSWQKASKKRRYAGHTDGKTRHMDVEHPLPWIAFIGVSRPRRNRSQKMNEHEFQSKLAELMGEISTLPATERSKLEKLADETRQRHERLRQTVSSLQESLDYLRLSIKYLVFDLEATRRENGYLRKMLEETSGND
jgi:septal ring factor EnvC (AmiA/AmiB activator)